MGSWLSSRRSSEAAPEEPRLKSSVTLNGKCGDNEPAEEKERDRVGQGEEGEGRGEEGAEGEAIDSPLRSEESCESAPSHGDQENDVSSNGVLADGDLDESDLDLDHSVDIDAGGHLNGNRLESSPFEEQTEDEEEHVNGANGAMHNLESRLPENLHLEGQDFNDLMVQSHGSSRGEMSALLGEDLHDTESNDSSMRGSIEGSSERPFVCSILGCGATFKKQGFFTRHMNRYHSSDRLEEAKNKILNNLPPNSSYEPDKGKPFVCQSLGCDWSSKKLHQLKRHHNTAHNEDSPVTKRRSLHNPIGEDSSDGPQPGEEGNFSAVSPDGGHLLYRI